MDTTHDRKYYVRRQGRIDGPWPIEKLQAEIKLQKLGRHHELSLDGSTWTQAVNVPELFPRVAVRKTLRQPTSTPSSANSTIATALIPDPAIWFYSIDDQQFGPIELSGIVDMLRDGKLRLDSLIWAEGMGDWTPAECLPAVMERLESPSGSVGDQTGATMQVALSPKVSQVPLWSLGVGLFSLATSCLPPAGLLGGVAIVLGSLALKELPAGQGDPNLRRCAMGGIALGATSIFCTLLVAVVLLAIW